MIGCNMATCTLGPIVSSISGVVGGVEFRQSGGQTVVQSKPVMSRVATPAQELQRYFVSAYRDQFSSLSDVNKLKWGLLAQWWNKNVRTSGSASQSSLDLFVSWQMSIQHDDTPTHGFTKAPFLFTTPQIIPTSWSVSGALPWHCTITRAADSKRYGLYTFWRQTTWTGNSKSGGTWYRAHSGFNVSGDIYTYAFSDGLSELHDRMASPGKLEVRYHWVEFDPDSTSPSGVYPRWQCMPMRVRLSRA